jgi:3-oxoacyl-[acyl-carrier-protein] synthase II
MAGTRIMRVFQKANACLTPSCHLTAGAVTVKAMSYQKRDPKQRVVITGIGCCSVFGNDPDVFYQK